MALVITLAKSNDHTFRTRKIAPKQFVNFKLAEDFAVEKKTKKGQEISWKSQDDCSGDGTVRKTSPNQLVKLPENLAGVKEAKQGREIPWKSQDDCKGDDTVRKASPNQLVKLPENLAVENEAKQGREICWKVQDDCSGDDTVKNPAPNQFVKSPKDLAVEKKAKQGREISWKLQVDCKGDDTVEKTSPNQFVKSPKDHAVEKEAKQGRESAKLQDDCSGDDNARMEEQIFRLREQLTRSQRDVVAERKTCEKFMWMNSRLESRSRNLESVLKGDKAALKQLQPEWFRSKVDELEAASKQGQEEIDKLEAALKQGQEENQLQQGRFQSKIEDLEAALKGEKENLLQQQVTLTATRDELAKVNQKLATCRELCATLTEVKSDLVTEVQNLEERCAHLIKNQFELEFKIEDLEANARREEDSLRQVEEKAKLLSNLKSETESRTVELETKIQDLQSALRHEDDRYRFLCQICMDRPRNALCMPCKHFVCCQSCLQQHLKTKKDCPVCRQSIKDVIECYT